MGGVIQQKPRKAPLIQYSEGVALCPFCMFGGDSGKFAVSVKGGFHKRLGKCPRCGVISQWTTLKRRWTVQAFAEWCYKYSVEGFWKKVKWDDFTAGLRARGLLDAFWDIYHDLKSAWNG
jgi:hypothetical protein